jgi:uncharacterized protein with LGFP repeats
LLYGGYFLSKTGVNFAPTAGGRMSGQATRRSTMFHRIAIGLLAVAVAVLLAPGAAASPESDAADAITAAFDASGGDGGPLGPPNGDAYPVGAGFAQNFASGKIFFTPATGAHLMTGAILEKYESLGGAADGDLGFPTIDEGPGRAPDSRNTTFSANDNPVIFWTPDTGARVVRGPINAAWDKLGGSAGPLGVPADDETYGGALVTQKFTGGELSFNTRDRTFSTVPPDLAGQLVGLTVPDDPAAAINTARRAAGGPLGPLGAAAGEPYPIGKNGLAQNFAGGKIFYSPDTGANVVTGQILAKYDSVGGPEGDLGFPTSSETDGGFTTESRITRFAADDKPAIFWTPEYGAVIVRGAMNAAWDRLGGAKGALGAPTADQTESNNVITQKFSGGIVSYDPTKSAFTTEPANLAADLAGLEVPGQKASEAPQASSTTPEKNWFAWSWWWLLAIVPVLVLIGLVAFATVRRRGGQGEDPFAFDDADYGDADYGDEPSRYSAAPGPERSSDEDYSASMFGENYAREGLGAIAPRAFRPEPDSVWGAPVLGVADADKADSVDDVDDAVDDDYADEDDDPDEDEEGALLDDEDDDPDAVDTTPTPIPKVLERDPMIDSGRHARIEDEEPQLPRTAFRLPLEDPDEPPEGYPVKADTKSGLYWAPESEQYDVALAEIWFASEELAEANGFVAADDY